LAHIYATLTFVFDIEVGILIN